MRKSIRRIVCMTAAILVLFSLVPAPARAVDPVSAATMANALAQAITAYGASQGVSMMYDVTDTNGIGEGVHDLWDQFKTDINDNDVPTYDSLAVTTWSTIYKKVGNSVAINLSDTTVSYLDRFWNWLLSGPAEMTKVDNQYYEWTLNESGKVDAKLVNSITTYTFNGVEFALLPVSWIANNNTLGIQGSQTSYVVAYQISDAWYIAAISGSSALITGTLNGNPLFDKSLSRRTGYNIYYSQNLHSYSVQPPLPVCDFTGGNSSSTDFAAYLGMTAAQTITDDMVIENNDISVQPYVGAETPENVYLPDNDDVNYQPLPYVGPLDIPWQNAWGDGETVTDAIGTSIAGALDQEIANDGTLELEGDNTVNPPIDDVIGGPDDYQVPGLADVFPFCIPFDIYNFLSALAADPVAPHFQAQLDFPEAIGGTQTIDIDFDSPTWNQLAQLLRLLELLAFIVGLALLTRSMFIRG